MTPKLLFWVKWTWTVPVPPYLPTESSCCLISEKPVLISKLSQLDLAEVGTVSSGHRWDCQQAIRELEEVCIFPPEFVSIDLSGIPLEGRDGHIGACFQDGTPSGKNMKGKHEVYK